MNETCPKCGNPCEDASRCAVCETRVPESNTLLETTAPRDLPDGPSFARRLLVGGLCLLGGYQALKHLTLALAVSQGADAVLSAEAAFGLMVAATLAAAAFAGTVNRFAELTGLLLSFGASAGLVGEQVAADPAEAREWAIGVTALLAGVGALGGFVGRMMIPPSPTVPAFGRPDLRTITVARRKRHRFVAWRAAVGMVILLVGVLNAEAIRESLSRVLAGNSGGWGSGRLLTWQVSVVTAILGGLVAGANTRSGWRQGLAAGFFGAVGVVVALRTQGGDSPIVGFWQENLGVPPGNGTWALVGGSTLACALVGGWLGGQVFPPKRR